MLQHDAGSSFEIESCALEQACRAPRLICAGSGGEQEAGVQPIFTERNISGQERTFLMMSSTVSRRRVSVWMSRFITFME